MKKYLFITVTLSFFLIALDVQASERIAVVNMSNIFEQLPQRTVVAQRLKDEFENRVTDLKNRERELQHKIQKLQRDSSTMKASDRNRIEKEIIVQRERLSSKAQAFNQDNHRRQIEERNKLLKYIQKAVKKVADSKGYNIVIDTNAIVYISTIKDITDDVLKQVK
ncbi:OmpH family outer membrane protein [Pantoea sp. Aalb]|uniref:OmpH family outer membrane protein n=1 Tax=Pantoea sp. Aalb TaxID=2576762 RepID=UPI001320FEEE|nr:OmpH family outer membrane protein [Pantoea sp. Aalb]MXP67224.1 molecular chaperone [Pantoea sp. Aalb]